VVKSKRKFTDEKYPDFILIKGLTKIDSVTYAVVSSIDEEKKVNGKTFLDQQINIINIETEEVKTIQLGKKGVDDYPEFIIWNGKKLLTGTFNSNPPYNIFKPYIKSITKGLLYEIDTSGDWKIAFETDTLHAGIKEVFIDNDGDYIFASNSVGWYNIQNTDKYIWYARPLVFKLDKDYNLVWEKPFGLDFDFNYFYKTSRILEAEEGDGYILAGHQPNYPWYITVDKFDSLRAANNPPMIVGILQKITEDGDSVWLRTYSVVRDTNLYTVTEHFVKDMVYAPDGGYILNGEINYDGRPGIDTAANYHGWLFKVDKDGCFVPGCGETPDTTNLVEEIEDIEVKIYPNPTSERLFVYQKEAKATKYIISDMSGRKRQSWQGKMANHTFIVDVSKFKPGLYILQVEREDGKVGVGKFVVED